MLDCSILAKTILVNTDPNEFPGLLMVLNGKSTSAGGYPYGASGYLGGYPMGGYGAVGYGGTPIVSPKSPLWNSSVMVGSRRSPMPFRGPAMYPGYLNGGFVGMPGACHTMLLSCETVRSWFCYKRRGEKERTYMRYPN